MTVKERVLLLLEENKNNPLSGEDMALSLNCTRAAIWKAVKTLQSEGYKIEAVSNRGYTLTTSPDVLSEAFIKDKVKEAGFNINIITKSITDSTNTQLKTLAASGETKDMIMIAEEQTAGKGRRGRSFFSPGNTGIYLSFLLHPDVPVNEAPVLTTIAATATALTLEKILLDYSVNSCSNCMENEKICTGLDDKVQIKWVNDIYIRGKKVAGILTEASTSIEDGSLDYAVPGIGINIYEPVGGFPEEIKDVAGTVFTDYVQRENLRNNLASELIINFLKLYYAKNTADSSSINYVSPKEKISRAYISEYKKRSLVIGKEVTILTPDHEPIKGDHSTATVIDINDDCHLLLRYNDGEEEYISNGEISVKL